MTTKIQNLVTEAVSLDREISEQTERLKALKTQLVEAVREHEDELTPTDGGGLRWTAEGKDGCIARVNFPVPSLKSKSKQLPNPRLPGSTTDEKNFTLFFRPAEHRQRISRHLKDRMVGLSRGVLEARLDIFSF
jgi:hypothetical protein